MDTVTDYIKLTNTKFIISSHVSTYEKCALRLIESYKLNNIPIENIIVVIGGCDQKLQKGNIIHTDHNSYDHNGIIEIVEKNLKSKYWFISHDTCEAGPNFFNLIKNFKISSPYISITEMGWLNMGLFSQKFIENNCDYIKSLKNCSKRRAILSERVFTKLDKYDHFGKQSEVQIIEGCKIYNDGKKRNTLYFPFIDFYKFQSFDAAKEMELLK